jgi:hypothetical protein
MDNKVQKFVEGTGVRREVNWIPRGQCRNDGGVDHRFPAVEEDLTIDVASDFVSVLYFLAV